MASIETTLSSPLLRAPYEQFLAAYECSKVNPRSETARLAASFRSLAGSPTSSQLITCHCASDTPYLYKHADKHETLRAMAHKWLLSSLAFTDRYVTSLQGGLEDILGKFPGFRTLHLSQSDILNPTVIRAYTRTLFWQNIVEGNVKAARRGGWLQLEDNWCSRRFSVVPTEHTGLVLLTHDAVLMLKDLTYSHFLIHLYATISPPHKPISELLEHFLTWGEMTLISLGEKGYGIIKGVEALTTVKLVLLTEKWVDASVQARDMVEKYTRKEVDSGGTGGLTKALWARIDSIQSVSLVAEYFGFMKLLGHPYVDPREGVAKVRRLVFSSQKKDLQACEALGFSICHLYTRGYLASKGHWPPIRFIRRPTQQASRLEQLYAKQHPALAPGFTQYAATDWRMAVFEPHLTFDMGEDILSLLSDKALSYKREEFDAVWYGKLSYKPPRPTTSKRVLLDFLAAESFDLGKFTQDVMERSIPRSHFICAQSPKEREMKWDAPRMFVKFTGPIRSFFNNVEKNTKAGPFQYFKEQTMTMDRQELLRRFLATTTPRGERWVDLHIGIDFSSWNLCWDDQNHSTPTGTRMDEWFGTPGVHTFCHWFFENSLSIMDNSDYPPIGLTSITREQVLRGEINLDTAYSGHSKGYEGIQQGAWTLSTIALCHQAISDLGIPFLQSGQGDNQVFTFHLYIPPGTEQSDITDHVRHIADDILNRLNRTASLVGHEIKPEECVVSTSFYIYGKEMYVDGRYVPSSTKFLSRIFPHTTADTPSTYEYVSSVGSGGIAATEKANSSLSHLVITKFIEHMIISRELDKSLFHDDALKQHLQGAVGPLHLFQQTLVDLLSSVPANLGGLPVSSPLEFLYRGHSDPLSSSLASLKLLAKLPGIKEYQSVLLKDWVYKKEPTPDGLILDPYSLPIAGVSPPSQRVANAVKPIFTAAVNNTLIKDVLSQVHEGQSQSLMGWLSNIRPFYPKLAHDLYKSSLVGLVDTFCKRFTNTRTLIHLTTHSGINVRRISQDADLSFMYGVITRLSMVYKVGGFQDVRCTTNADWGNLYQLAAALRFRWGVGKLEGVTTLHPIFAGQILVLPRDHIELIGDREIVVMSQFSDSTQCGESRGSVTPYMGSKTSDKSVGKWIRPQDSSPPYHDVIRILTIQSMVALPESRMWEDLDKLAQSRTTLPLSLLREFCRIRIGGTIAHRWQTRDDNRGSFVNISTNWPSHLTISTNHAGSLGLIDYPFDFQEAITTLQGLLTWWSHGRKVEPPFGLVLRVSTTLMDPINDHFVDAQGRQLQVPTPLPSYYTTLTSLRVSSRTTKAALLNPALPMERIMFGVGSFTSALTTILFYHASGNIETSTKFGHTMGSISHRRIIDMPELGCIDSVSFKQCLAEALYLRVALGACCVANTTTRRLEKILPLLLSTEVRRTVPSLYGTIRELDSKSSLGKDGLGLGHAESPRTLSHWMATLYTTCLSIGHRVTLEIYLRGPASASRSILASLGTECLLLMQQGDKPNWKTGKEMAKLLLVISRNDDEVLKVELLTELLHILRIGHLFRRVSLSPEEVVRRLRGVDQQEIYIHTLHTEYRTLLTPLPPLPCTPLDRPLESDMYYPTFEEQVLSWERREVVSFEPGVLWSPITMYHPGQHLRVLILGIGDGMISHALDPTWIVTGLDLGTVLATQSHAMVNYHPPHMRNKFVLHPASWALGGDIQKTLVCATLRNELSSQSYDLCLIDVDRVSSHIRLQVRHELAQSGVPCYAKIMVHPSLKDKIEASFLAYKDTSDHMWSSRAYPHCEMVIGQSSEPLGLFDSVEGYSGNRINWSAPQINSRNLRTWAGPIYDPTEDIFLLAGDLIAVGTDKLSLKECKSIQSYLDPNDYPCRDLLPILLERGCPKNRVRALHRLITIGHIV